jgi:hypothetical protein
VTSTALISRKRDPKVTSGKLRWSWFLTRHRSIIESGTKITKRKEGILVGDWDFTDQEFKEMDRKAEEFAKANPNHPAVIRGREYVKRHPELFQEQNKQAKAGK